MRNFIATCQAFKMSIPGHCWVYRQHKAARVKTLLLMGGISKLDERDVWNNTIHIPNDLYELEMLTVKF
jgi:hypothetical protein